MITSCHSFAFAHSVDTTVLYTVAQHLVPDVALRAIGLPHLLAPPSDPGPMAFPQLLVPLSVGTQTTRLAPSNLPHLVLQDAMAATGVSSSQQLASVERQRDSACRDLAAVTAELHKMSDKNDELRSFLAAFRNVLYVSLPFPVGLKLQIDVVVNHLTRRSMSMMKLCALCGVSYCFLSIYLPLIVS